MVQTRLHHREVREDPTAAYVSAGEEPVPERKSRGLAVAGLAELQSRWIKAVNPARTIRADVRKPSSGVTRK